MSHSQFPRQTSRHLHVESLEARDLLTAVPFGASAMDTAEFLLGHVLVNVVLLESDGSVDPDTEQWRPELVEPVKANIEEGLQWWSDTLDKFSDVHDVTFTYNYTYADDPVETGYEPISRPSDDFVLWIDDFFAEVGVESNTGFSDAIRTFNHEQRLEYDANWSFTIFVVNADEDPDNRFDLDGTFSRAFAFSGGRFIVMPHTRPASTVAHELGHIFWAFDEYSGSEPYSSSRGYYDTQNVNAADGHPSPESREPSLMISTGTPFTNHELSQSAREMIGWRDSDGDGIFDVLDVDHTLSGTASYDISTGTARFAGSSHVNTLPNMNPRGTGNDMTLNRITELQYRVDFGSWVDLQSFDDYQIDLDAVTPELPENATWVEFRTIDNRIGVTSNVIQLSIETPLPTQNPIEPLDVTGDGFITAIDALRIIRALNDGFTIEDGPPYYDVSGDQAVSSRDALLIINHLNEVAAQTAVVQTASPRTVELASALTAAATDEEGESENVHGPLIEA